MKKLKDKRTKKRTAESILDDVEGLLDDGSVPVHSDVQGDAELPNRQVEVGEVLESASVDATGGPEGVHPANANAGDAGRDAESEPSDVGVSVGENPARISFDDMVEMFKEDPAKFTVLACEYTARMMLAQERIADALERIAINSDGLFQTQMTLVDMELRKVGV